MANKPPLSYVTLPVDVPFTNNTPLFAPVEVMVVLPPFVKLPFMVNELPEFIASVPLFSKLLAKPSVSTVTVFSEVMATLSVPKGKLFVLQLLAEFQVVFSLKITVFAS